MTYMALDCMKAGIPVCYPEGKYTLVCEFCEGTDEESFDESDGEGHITRGTGTRRCRHLED